MAATDRLARDLERWARKLDRMPERLEVLDWTVGRAIALHLSVDVRRDVERRVGGRTLSVGRAGRGYRAGVWAAPHKGASGDWWVGGSGKAHWLDLGTAPHVVSRKRRGRGKKSAAQPGLLNTPWGPRVGPFHHPGTRGDGTYRRSVARHDTAALAHGADLMQRTLAAEVTPDG